MSSSRLSQDIAVYGAGSWGTALAIQLSRNGRNVLLWGRETDELEEMGERRSNEFFLPGIQFPDSLQIETSLEKTIRSSRRHLIVIPCNGVRGFLESIQPWLSDNSSVIWASKGLEMSSGKLLHEVFLEVIKRPIPHAVVSGPTFAREVASGLPTAMTLAASDNTTLEDLLPLFHNENMRVYRSNDLIGVQLGGALKNVLAIAAGIADGLGFGANARSALITRGLAEIIRLGENLGAQRETLMGLAGLGDLILTCTDDQSRNRRFGLAIGQGRTQQQAFDEIQQVVEGAKTAKVIVAVAEKANVEMPICKEVYKVLYQGQEPKNAVKDLLSRHSTSEF